MAPQATNSDCSTRHLDSPGVCATMAFAPAHRRSDQRRVTNGRGEQRHVDPHRIVNVRRPTVNEMSRVEGVHRASWNRSAVRAGHPGAGDWRPMATAVGDSDHSYSSISPFSSRW